MNSFIRQPAFYPVQVAFVDDSTEYLGALQKLFPDSRLNRFFAKPHEAVRFVRERYCNPKSRAAISPDDMEAAINGGNALGHDILTDTSRFDRLAAVVVDYEMSEIDGISLLTAIKDIPCTKVLLTGVANESAAVDAFNDGLIDCYLKKSDRSLSKKLAAIVSKAKEKHCAQNGQVSVGAIGHPYCDPRTVDLVKQIVATQRLVEYYWRPEQNAVLMFDSAGNPSVFLAWDENDWQFQCEVMADAGGPDSLLDDMRVRRSMPVFWPSLSYQPDMPIIRILKAAPIPGWHGAFYGWTELDPAHVDAAFPTFAKWRTGNVPC